MTTEKTLHEQDITLLEKHKILLGQKLPTV